MRKREKNTIVLTTTDTRTYLKQKPIKAIAFPTAGVFSFSLSRVLLPPTD